MPKIIKPCVGVDMDGVIYPFDAAARTILHLNGYDIRLGDDISQYWDHLPEEAGPQAMDELWTKHRRTLFEAAPAYPDAIKALHQIEQHARLVILTHRPLDVAHITMRWLAAHKINPHMLIHGAGEPKSFHAKECIAFIEDRSSNALELVRNTDAHVFVPERGWNRDLYEERYVGEDRLEPIWVDRLSFFRNWKDVTKWIEKRVSDANTEGS